MDVAPGPELLETSVFFWWFLQLLCRRARFLFALIHSANSY